MKKTTTKPWKILLIVFSIFAVLCTAAFLYFYIPSLNIKLDESRFSDNVVNVSVYDNRHAKLPNGELFASGDYIKSQDIPQYVKDSFIYLEDKRFYSHNGVDAKRMLGAVLENVKSMRFKEGASTITQQLIKNTHLSNEKTLSRKFAEIRLALELEKRQSKDKILEMYLNSVYFGNNAYGIVKAADFYFGKNVRDLTIAESATLAGIINAPNAYSPDKNPEKSIERRNLALNALLANGKISQTDYDSAINSAIDTKKIGLKSNEKKSYADMAVAETAELLGMTSAQVKHSDLRIFTYMDAEKQKSISSTLKSCSVKTVGGKNAQKMAISVNNQTGGVEAFFANTEGNPYYTKRQVGSVAKPLVALAPSFEQNLITPATMILDEATDFGGYKPSNIGEKYDGWITVRNAIAKSKNVPAVKLLNALDKNAVKSALLKMDYIDENTDIQLKMALGSFDYGLTIGQLSQGYAMLANGGLFGKSAFVKKIEDASGRVLYANNAVRQRIFREDTAYLTTSILTDVVKNGTAKGLDVSFAVAGKTGTVGKKNCPNNSDALFCSYTPSDTTVFWVYSNYDDLLEANVSGSSAPVNLAGKYYNAIYNSKNPGDFEKPDSVVKLKIDEVLLKSTGKIEIANRFIPKNQVKSEYFSVFNPPSKTSERLKHTVEKDVRGKKSFLQDFFDEIKRHPFWGA